MVLVVMVLVVMWEGMVVLEGVGVVVGVVVMVGILVIVGVGIVVVGLKLIINLSSSMKSFGLSGVIGAELFSLVKLKSSKHGSVGF